MNIAFYTLGCKVNQYETQSLREAFLRAGHTPVSEDSVLDAIVINSCTVTAESDRKTRQILHRFRRKNANAVIVLTGCMVQAFFESAKTLADADVVIGNTDINKTVELTEHFFQKRQRISEFFPHNLHDSFNTPLITDFAERTRAYMKIEDGCNRFCSYCIIPKARGFVRSKNLKDIEKETAELASKGFLEIVLVGINLSAYGREENINICDAVDVVCKNENIKRVRLGSLEPDHISDEMLLRFKNQPKFCPQFHLSLQSGCDKTLKKMNRHYNCAFYTDLVTRIRNMFENASITTDIMVGFAGETENDFLESLQYLKRIGFAKTHVFSYSRRKGTVAYDLPNQISKAEKNRRSILMCEAAAESEALFLNNQIGTVQQVLFETAQNNTLFGYTENYSRVCAIGSKHWIGEIKSVKIISALNECLEGIII